MHLHPILKLSDIDLCYKDSDRSLVIFNKANFSLGAGEAVALIAPSGAGKSTLLHIAGLLERPESGEVWICGKACSQLGEDARTKVRRSEIGFVYQFHYLLPEFTALENVMIPQMIAGLDRKIAVDRSLSLLKYLRINHRSGHLPSELSGGEQQRVAIARSVANAPLILLADEPTGNLDPITSDYVFRALFALVRESGLSTLVATHNYNLAEKMDRRITLDAGKVIELD